MPASNPLGQLGQDTRFALRVLRKSPGFTAVAVIVLALGIGVNTAFFSVVNGVILRPLPFPQADRLVTIQESDPAHGWPQAPTSFPNYQDWKQQNHTLAAISPLYAVPVALTGEGPAEMLGAAVVSASLFPMLGTTPVTGRLFRPEDDQPAAARVVILSRATWQRRFGSDPQVVGRQLVLDDHIYTVAGVVPDLELPALGRPAVWLPLPTGIDSWRQAHTLDDRNQRSLGVLGQLSPGVTLEQARAEFNTLATRAAAAYPQSYRGTGVVVQRLQDDVVGDARRPLLLLFAAVGLVLLMACANVANLLMARVASRRREFAIRVALGSGQARLLRQMLTENLLLSLAGGLCAWLLAGWAVQTLVHVAPRTLPRMQNVQLDGAVLVFGAAISVITAVLFGLAPALAAAHVDPFEWLKENDRSGTGGQRQRYVRQTLMAAEIALSVMLLVGAGLALRSFRALSSVHTGFQTEHVLTARVIPPPVMDATQRSSLYDEILRRVSVLPGVDAAGAAQTLPLRNGDWTTSFRIVGRPVAPDQPVVSYNRVAGDYFRAMRIALRQGRYFTPRDRAGAPSTAIVNESFARRFLAGSDPLGSQISIWGSQPAFEIVGVVADTTQRRLEATPQPTIYLPYAQAPRASMTLVMRAVADPAALASAIRREVSLVSANQPVADFATMDRFVEASLAPRRYPTMLLGLFAALALILASVGVYGVVSYAVAQRTREMGLRMALGAHPSSVVRLVLRQALRVAGAGVLIGSLGALSLTGLMRGLLFGVQATDPLTFVAVPVLLLAISALAAYVPARRASRVDPLIALRCD